MQTKSATSAREGTTTKAARRAEHIETKWEIATYDVWGNAKDGYEVNDVYRRGEVDLTLTVTVNNERTPAEFRSAYPTDKQLRQVFGVRCQIETEGDDLTVYVNRARDGYQIGELHCVSHASLSPIRAKD